MAALRSKAKEVWTNIRTGKNLDITSEFVLSIFTLLISISGLTVPKNLISALTVAILASLSLSLLKERTDREKLQKSINNISVSENCNMKIRSNYEEIIRNLIRNSTDCIWIIIRTGSIFYEAKAALEYALEEGCKIKIVVCESNNKDLINTIELYSDQDQEEIKRKFESGKNAFVYLQNKYPKLIERKTIGFMPSQLMYITDANENNNFDSNSTIFIIPLSFKSNPRKAPSLNFKFNENPELFKYYYQQIKRFW